MLSGELRWQNDRRTIPLQYPFRWRGWKRALLVGWPTWLISDQVTNQLAPLSAWESSMCSSANCASVGGWESSCTLARTHCSTVNNLAVQGLQCVQLCISFVHIVYVWWSNCAQIAFQKLCWHHRITLVPCEPGATFALQHVHNTNHSLLEPESTIFCHSFSSSVSTPPIFASHHRSCWQRRVGGSDNQESSPLVDHMTTDRCLIASPESFLLYSAFTSTFHRFATLEMLSLFYCAIWITMIQIQSL